MSKCRIILFGLIAALVLSAVSACSLPTRRPDEPFTAAEQLLLSEALENGAKKLRVGLPEGSSVVLDTSALGPGQGYIRDVLTGWLGKQGIIVKKEEKEATYRVQVIVQSFGPSRNVRIVGFAGGQAQAWLLGIRVPELALYKRDTHRGYARFYLNIYDEATGEYVSSTRKYIGTASRQKFTYFFIFHTERSDIEKPPLDEEE